MDTKEADKAVESLCSIVIENAELIQQLRAVATWQERWLATELYIINHLNRVGISHAEFQKLWIRDRVFHKLAEQTGLDYGWCKYFRPNFRNRTQSILTGDLNLDLDHYCTFGGETLETTCSGTNRDICVYLQPKETNPNWRKELHN